MVYVSSGEGTTSEGEFHEAMNTACSRKLPVIFHIEDNGYAISVPVEVQTAGGSISKLMVGYPYLLVLEFDGCCPEVSYDAWAAAVGWTRARKGPVLLHAHVVRPYSHSMSDDERLYRTEAEREEEEANGDGTQSRRHGTAATTARLRRAADADATGRCGALTHALVLRYSGRWLGEGHEM